jgi:hypothetical protein
VPSVTAALATPPRCADVLVEPNRNVISAAQSNGGG